MGNVQWVSNLGKSFLGKLKITILGAWMEPNDLYLPIPMGIFMSDMLKSILCKNF